MSAKNKSCPLIPQEERKCIWMTTGLISYKLCDRSYHCETCPFDQAIKNEQSCDGSTREEEDNWAEGITEGDPSVPGNGNIFYHPTHSWVKVEDPENARVGIDDLITQLISGLKIVILPQLNSLVGQGECFAHIIQEDYILPVISPLSGSIQTVNKRLTKEPGLVTTDPRGEGWLVTVKPDNLESDLKNLIFGRKALLWYQKEEKEMLDRTEILLRRNQQNLGPTMQDGGVRISRLKDMLGSVNTKQRAQILDFCLNRRQN